MKRKVLSLVICLSVVLGLFAGCAPTTTTPPPAPTATPQTGGSQTEEEIVLRWALWDYDTTPYWGALVDAYKKVKPNVTIEHTDLEIGRASCRERV